jgi:hypothetical protein
MDEQSSQQEAENLAARSATALRALEERARKALAASRDQTSRLESAITSQFDAIDATIASEQAAETQTAADVAIMQLEVDRLTKELSDAQAAWVEERTALESTRNEMTRQLAEVQAGLEKTRDESANRLTNAESQEAELRAEIKRLLKDLEDLQAAWSAERSSLEQSRDSAAEQIESLQSELQTLRDESANRLAKAESQGAANDNERAVEITRLTKVLEDLRAAWLVEQSAFEAERDELKQQVAALLAAEQESQSKRSEHEVESRTEIDRLTKELAATRADWAAEQSALELARDELAKQFAKLQVDEKNGRADWAKQLNDFEEKLRNQQSAWNDQRTEWSVARATLEVERDSLQQKFELAAEDLQRYRERVGELEQDLSRRPEATQADSAELVALRAERDALADRIEQLEQQPAVQVDADAEQQMADLQRRFEMAVEDVRELKTKNAQLEAKLASGERVSGRSGDSGALDWEAQKRRLLASLEDEGDTSDEPERHQERLRIESTIEMTDAVVAEKDVEIAELKAQLAQGGSVGAVADDKAREQQVCKLVDADEVIAEHRKRTADMERDMEEKLRAAELELSVSRAKIARERVELDEMRADLESRRANMVPDGAPSAPGAPKRRWLSKLGLNGEEQ